MSTHLADERGYFGNFGGRWMPEALVAALDELTVAWREAMVCGPTPIGLSPEAVATRLGGLRRLTDELGRPALTATVVGPQLDADPHRAAEQFSAYEVAGTQQVILPPTGTD